MASSSNAPITPRVLYSDTPGVAQKELLSADVAALKQALREKQKALTTVMRKEKRANLNEQATEIRDVPCIHCMRSAASSKSNGSYIGHITSTRYIRCIRGNMKCISTPLIVLPFGENVIARHEAVIHSAAANGRPRTAEQRESMHAIAAWRVAESLMKVGSFDQLYIRIRRRGSGDTPSVPEDAKRLLRELADQAGTSDQEESRSSDESEGSSESEDSVEDEDEEMED
ncbi:hypothetical protein S40288_11557 [Stachybotrys chartarum IBT 40288]|nr:hypothetical protein S40288_11557 [Stachybotrys chartarum IBT 40288]